MAYGAPGLVTGSLMLIDRAVVRVVGGTGGSGASFGQIDGALSIVNPLLSFDQWKKVKELWRTVREGWSPGD